VTVLSFEKMRFGGGGVEGITCVDAILLTPWRSGDHIQTAASNFI
jgi:hypothetical protein